MMWIEGGYKSLESAEAKRSGLFPPQLLRGPRSLEGIPATIITVTKPLVAMVFSATPTVASVCTFGYHPGLLLPYLRYKWCSQ